MESTQSIDCTQVQPLPNLPKYKIGSLLINGNVYPIHYGPNRIGREAGLCEIHLNFPSISRLHCIINASSNHNIVIMDLGSFNKTKLEDITLKPNMPYSLKDGSTVQFGALFGVFRLWEDESEALLTQAMEIPETPVYSRHATKIKNMHTIPESPDSSGLESFIGQSRTSSTLYMDLNEPNVSFSNISTKKTSKCVETSGNESIHNANTQELADQPHIVPSVFEMDTQDPTEFQFKMPDAQNMSKQKDIKAKGINNENVNKSVYEAETQIFDNENLELTKCQPAWVHNVMITGNHEVNDEIDCDDIEPSQKLPVDDDDVTDCEDECDIPVNNSMKTAKNTREEKNECSDKKEMIDIDFHDLPTQVIENENENNTNFQDLPTQVFDENISNKNSNPVALDVLTKNVNFKVPFTVENNKKSLKSPSKANTINKVYNTKHSILENECNDNNYYSSTQEILTDLCSQKSVLDEARRSLNLFKASNLYTDFSEELVPDPLSKQCKNNNVLHPVENCKIGKQIRPTVSSTTTAYISNLSNTDSLQEVSNTNNAIITKVDSSDPEVTPTKMNPKQFITVELPDSQEIKALVNSKRKHVVTYETSESETDENSEDQYTPILHRKKKRPRKDIDAVFPNVKINTECLPSRILTRNRKPSKKILEADDKTRRNNKVILKSNVDLEENIAKEIIIENIARLKNTSSNKGTKEYETKGTDVSQKSLIKTRTTIPKNYLAEETKQSKKNCNDNNSDKRTETSKKKSTDKSNLKINDCLTDTANKKTITAKSSSEIKDKSIEPPYKSLGTRSKAKENKVTDTIKKDNKTTTAERPLEIKGKSCRSSGTRSKRNASKEKDDATKSLQIVNGQIEETRSNKKAKEENKEKSKREKNNKNATDLRVQQPRKVKHNLLICCHYVTQRSELKKLAVNIVTDVKNCSILLIEQFRRTFKILCAISLGIPIVGPGWVQSCLHNNTVVDPWLHLFKDEAKEKHLKFNLKETLTGKRNFLKGYQISSTPSVVPGPEELKMIVECSGGVWVGECGAGAGGAGAAGRWVVISCRKDTELWPRCRLRGATVVSSEAILLGVLRQRLDLRAHRL